MNFVDQPVQRKIPVTITEEFMGKSGIMWTRAVTANGNKIIAASALFNKRFAESADASVNADEISTSASLAKLKMAWAK